AFMGGLGLGSYLSGRYLTKRRSALVLFGLFEAGVGVYALALPSLLPLAERAFTETVGGWGLSIYGESFLKLLLSLVLLLPPTTLMGATLPLLSQHTVRHSGNLGLRVGSLYAINTLGATAGCFLAGFYGIAWLGIRGTTMVAAATNFSVALAALALGARARSPAVEPAGTGVESAAAPALSGSGTAARWAMLAFGVSGFAALGFQVIWTRLMTLVFKGFTYSFSSMLTVFLAGIALGSLAFGGRVDRSRDPLRLFGLLEMAIGVSVLALLPFFVNAQVWVSTLGHMLGGAWQDFAKAKFVVAFLLLFIPTFLFGGTFPVVSRLSALRVKVIGSVVGNLYAANVLGGIAGAFAAGFVLIPLIGTSWSLYFLSFALLLLGMVLLSSSPAVSRGMRLASGSLVAVVATVILLDAPKDVSLAIHRSWLARSEEIGFYKEGSTATVMVAEYTGETPGGMRTERRILVTGSSASNSSYYGLSVNRIQGCLPFLFERMPRKVLAMCFGTGITFGTVSQFDITRMDGVEISPEVIDAAPRFREENYDVVNNPRMHIHIDDGRNFLLKSRERYDVITMEPMPPALAGVVDLYTREFYELCQEHLEPGGVVSQWVPLYFMGLRDVKMIYRTFAEAFPYAMVFFYQFDTFLVGSDQPLRLSSERFFERLQSDALKRDLAAIKLDTPTQLLGTFLMDRKAMLNFASGVPILTDDLPYVEFTAAKVTGLSTVPENYLTITQFAQSPSQYLAPPEPGSEGQELLEALDALFRTNLTAWEMARNRRRDLGGSVGSH
ncbi:MAG: fused MFS/spermidine synthase, partial [Acidobacteriota bacterium]